MNKAAIIVDFQNVEYAMKIRTLRTSAAMKLVETQRLRQQLHQVAIIMVAMNVSNFAGVPSLIIVVEHQMIPMVDLDVVIVHWKIVEFVMKDRVYHVIKKLKWLWKIINISCTIIQIKIHTRLT